jgi:hypothetical protein
MHDSRKRPQSAAECRAREGTDQEREEANRRERREEISMALRVMLIIWDIAWSVLH